MQLTDQQKDLLRQWALGWSYTNTNPELLRQMQIFEFVESDEAEDFAQQELTEQAALVYYIGSFVPDAVVKSDGILMQNQQWKDTTNMLYNYHCLGIGNLPTTNPHEEADKWLSLLASP